MMKKLYFIERKDTNTEDEHYAAVICASSVFECRKIAHKYLEGKNDVWLTQTTVTLLGDSAIETEDDGSAIILAAFNGA